MKREIRPRFELRTDESADELMRRMSQSLRCLECPLCGIAAEGRVELYVPPARQRLWSPELQLDVRTTEEGTLLEGKYGPHPHVWAAYAAILGLSAVATTAALTFALAEWIMRQPMTALYALLPLGLVFAGTYAVSFIGQDLAAKEMDELRAFVEDVVYSSVPLPSGVRIRISSPPAQPTRRVG